MRLASSRSTSCRMIRLSSDSEIDGMRVESRQHSITSSRNTSRSGPERRQCFLRRARAMPEGENGDLIMSRDAEDILLIVDGREELLAESRRPQRRSNFHRGQFLRCSIKLTSTTISSMAISAGPRSCRNRPDRFCLDNAIVRMAPHNENRSPVVEPKGNAHRRQSRDHGGLRGDMANFLLLC